MAFPDTPLDLRADLQIGGTWADITSTVYARDPITIVRGRTDEGQRVDAARCSLTLNNRDASYSPLHPLSPNYQLIGRNTPLRISVPNPESYLRLDGDPANYVTTPDHASLDITGDIDVRAEVSADWYSTRNQVLIAKWDSAGTQRSYSLRILNGSVILNWSTDGTPSNSASFLLPGLPARAALRITLDVDNGAAGRTIRAYWAESLDGPWTQIGDDLIQAGTTSIFASTAPLIIGGSDATTDPPRIPFAGHGHRFEVRSGINGTAVATPDFRALAAGTASFADSAGRTWTLTGTAAEVDDRNYRVQVEASSWPSRWDVSGSDVWVPVEGAGILRRLGQGAKPLGSTLRRRIPSFAPLAYWPMEEGREATQAYSPVNGVAPMATSGMEFAATDTLPGSSALPKLEAGAFLSAAVPVGTSGEWQVELVYNLETMPGSLTTLMEVVTTGTARKWRLQVATNNARLEGLASDDTQVFLINVTAPEFTGAWNRLQIKASTSGSTVTPRLRWITIGGGGSTSNASFTGTAGRTTAVSAFGVAGLSLGHLAVFSEETDDPFNSADQGFRGETAGARLLRLGTEQGVPISVLRPLAETPLVGAQRPSDFLTLLDECADVDGGVLYEAREEVELRYRPRTAYYSQTPALILDYAADGEVAPPLEPVDDDQRVRNDETVTRVGGSSARVTREDGPLSVQPPPNGVGVYDSSVTLNLYDDVQPGYIAGWRVHLGTWNEPRYPVVHIDLAAAPHLVNDVMALDIGDRIQIINPPAWLPPGPIDLIIEGYTETFGHPNSWDFTFNCSPAGPWTVAFADVAGYKAGSATSELAEDLTTTETGMDVAVTGRLWTTDAGQLPFDVIVGGERMTATAISGASSPQTWTVTRSVNGIVKTHTTGAAVRLADPGRASL